MKAKQEKKCNASIEKSVGGLILIAVSVSRIELRIIMDGENRRGVIVQMKLRNQI